MLPNEHFQKLLYDLFCLWHGVQRHYDPPFTDTEEQRLAKMDPFARNNIDPVLSFKMRMKSGLPE
ncbi:hypothetical protein DICVIV_08010 [Dictyocaulus viviparus]|uniref:Uncharacterized protein n=1 Tax=Dictyocaulus viviparus TaxID=29172 RepID=A0A0D8XQA2_DICVI|nr:hypothetical protein DICVIV_08010 [Dictyocaulus viviparus]